MKLALVSLTLFLHFGPAKAAEHDAFWKRVTNSLSPVEFTYARSLGRPAQVTATGYTPAVVIFEVKMQGNGLKIRFSDRLQLTNSHRIENEFHFAVGGFETNLWAMGAAKQIIHETVPSESVTLGDPIFKKSTGKSNLPQTNASNSPVLGMFRSHREEAAKVLHLGFPQLIPQTLVLSNEHFTAETTMDGPIEGDITRNSAGSIERADLLFTKFKVRRRLTYTYADNPATPAAIMENHMAGERVTLAVEYKFLNSITYRELPFTREELSAAGYYQENKDIRTFVHKEGSQYSIKKGGKLEPVMLKREKVTPNRSKWLLAVFIFVCASSVFVFVSRTTNKQTTKK